MAGNIESARDLGQGVYTQSEVNTAITDKVDKPSSTDNAIARFNGTGGAIQNSAVSIDDSGTIITSALNLDNPTGYARLEMGGLNGAYIDLKAPFSEDYDARLIHDGSHTILESKTGNLLLKNEGGNGVYVKDNDEVHIVANGTRSHVFRYNENGGEIQVMDESGSSAAILLDNSFTEMRFLKLSPSGNIQIGFAAGAAGNIRFLGNGGTEHARLVGGTGDLYLYNGKFVGTGAASVLAVFDTNGAVWNSIGVSSVSDISSTNKVINFSTAKANQNYIPQASQIFPSNYTFSNNLEFINPSTTSLNLYHTNENNSVRFAVSVHEV